MQPCDVGADSIAYHHASVGANSEPHDGTDKLSDR